MHGDDGGGRALADDLGAALHIPPLVALRGGAVQPRLGGTRLHDEKARLLKARLQRAGEREIEIALLHPRLTPHHAAVDTAVPRVDDDGHARTCRRRLGERIQTHPRRKGDGEQDGARAQEGAVTKFLHTAIVCGRAAALCYKAAHEKRRAPRLSSEYRFFLT